MNAFEANKIQIIYINNEIMKLLLYKCIARVKHSNAGIS
jgi:hypothetical protein